MTPRSARIALAATLLVIYSTLGVVRSITNALRDYGALRATVFAVFAIAGAFVVTWVVRDASNRTWRSLAGLLLMGAVYAAVVLPMKSVEEKIHFVQYGAVAVLAHFATPPAWSRLRRFVASALFVLAAGWTDEGIQGLLPSRVYDLRDVAFNAAAGLLALTALAIFSRHERNVGTDRPEPVARDADH